LGTTNPFYFAALGVIGAVLSTWWMFKEGEDDGEDF